MNFKLGRSLAVAFSLGLGSAFGQTYVATDLSTNAVPNFTYGMAYGIASPYQVGVGAAPPTDALPQALLWQGTASSVVNLTPPGYRFAYAYGISGSSSVGEGVTSTGQTNALYWPAPFAGSAVSLNPNMNGAPAALSEALGISGNQQVGYAQSSATNGAPYNAYLWMGSAGNSVNLHPAYYLSSAASATDGSQQAGYATASPGEAHAMVWFGTAASAQDLNPNGYMQSFATAVAQTGPTNSVVVGYVEQSPNASAARAYAWPYTENFTNAPVNLHPSGYLNSFANGVASTNVVGYGTTSSGTQVALLWRGYNSNAVVNLSTYLPSSATNSVATSIDSSGNIAGYAIFSGGSQTHAILWQPAKAPVFTSTPVNVSTTAGIPYNHAFTASGIPAPAFSSTNAPPGLTLASTGTFSGTPTNTGTFTGLIFATNGISPNASQSYSITVNPTPVQSYAVLHSFFGGSVPNDGIQPNSGLVQGSDGNLYGTTPYGGSGATLSGAPAPGSGTVFKISPEGAYTILHNFNDGTVSNDGATPEGALIEGTDGNYYGVTGGWRRLRFWHGVQDDTSRRRRHPPQLCL